GACGRPFKPRGVVDVAHLDGAAGGSDPQVTGNSLGPPAHQNHDGKKEGIVRARNLPHPNKKLLFRLKRPVRQVGPVPAFHVQGKGLIELRSVTVNLQRLQEAVPPHVRPAGWQIGWPPMAARKSHRLAQMVDVVLHARASFEVDPIVKTQDRGFLSYTLLLPTDYSNMIAGNSMPLLA